jgi:hypothetical protein
MQHWKASFRSFMSLWARRTFMPSGSEKSGFSSTMLLSSPNCLTLSSPRLVQVSHMIRSHFSLVKTSLLGVPGSVVPKERELWRLMFREVLYLSEAVSHSCRTLLRSGLRKTFSGSEGRLEARGRADSLEDIVELLVPSK